MVGTRQGWGISFLIVVAWLAIGVLPSLLYGVLWGKWPESPGTLGDSFGAATSLFSAAALIGLVVSLYLQNRQIEGAITDQKSEMEIQTKQITLQTQQTKELVDQTANQIKQTGVAQKAARVQALLFLADFQDRMMQRATGRSKERMLQKIVALNDRALILMEELGERFDDTEFGEREIEIPTDAQNAYEELEPIIQSMVKKRESEGPDKSEINREMNNFLGEVARQVKSWHEKYREHQAVIDVRPVVESIGLLNKNRKGFSKETTKPPLWTEYWSEVDEIIARLKDALESLRK